MKKHLSREQIDNISFPDAPVLDFHFDLTKGILTVVIDSYVGSSPEGKWFDSSIVNISEFESVEIFEDDARTIEVYSSTHSLKDICEFMVDPNEVVLRGFSQGAGLWTEYRFKNPKIQITV